MKSALFFAAALVAMPLYSAVSTGAVAIDASGNVWQTGKASFIATTPNAIQKTAAGSICATQLLSPFDKPTSIACNHAYLIERDASGQILYATYLGGSSEDGGTAVTTDSQGNVYVAGFTYSSDFPAKQHAAQTRNAGPLQPSIIPLGLGPFGPVLVAPGGDVFVAKFAPGGALIYATLLGGSGEDVPDRIGVDDAGSVYVSGSATSTDFPVTAGALPHQAASASFFARLSADGSSWTYSTGSDPSIQSFFITDGGDAYLTGYSQPPSATAANGGPYVTRIDTASGVVLMTSNLTALNSNLIASSGAAIAVAASGDIFIGVSPGLSFPNLPVYEPPFFPLGASYLFRLSADGSHIVSETDVAQTQFDSIEFDSAGNAYAFGHGTGALPAGPAPLLAAPCSPSGGSFVLEAGASGDLIAATYLRQGDDSAIRFTAPGQFEIFRRAGQNTAALDLTVASTPNFGCVNNLGSGEVGAGLAPGEIFVIYGSGIGPAQAAIGAPDSSGLYPTSLGGVQVIINGKPVPLFYGQAGEIHGVAPFSPGSTTVAVTYRGQPVSTPLDMPFALVNPAILVLPGGHAAAVNQDGTVNSASNPAKLGSIVSIYTSGMGYLETTPPDGSLTPIPPPFNTLEFTPQVRFAGVAGNVLWSGSAPGLIAGVSQINVQLPSALPAGTNLSAAPTILNSSETLSPSAPISIAP